MILKLIFQDLEEEMKAHTTTIWSFPKSTGSPFKLILCFRELLLCLFVMQNIENFGGGGIPAA